jgi:hypothetical protein
MVLTRIVNDVAWNVWLVLMLGDLVRVRDHDLRDLWPAPGGRGRRRGDRAAGAPGGHADRAGATCVLTAVRPVSVHREDPPSWWQRLSTLAGELRDDRALWIGVAIGATIVSIGYVAGYRDGVAGR